MKEEQHHCPYRIGNGYDIHRIEEGLPMWLCGIQVESSFGFVAHSDGDVAIHALCDAILGALALGDIGLHFPDTSEEWKGVKSVSLLSKVVSLASEKGWKVGNADITIALQKPKIAKYISQMRSVLSETMDIAEDCVSVKATTGEKLGFVGRSEGCQAWASVILYKPDAGL